MFMTFEVAKPLLGIYSREITSKKKNLYRKLFSCLLKLETRYSRSVAIYRNGSSTVHLLFKKRNL